MHPKEVGQRHRLYWSGSGKGQVADSFECGNEPSASMECRECTFINTLRTGLLNCLNACSRGLTFRHCACCI